MPRLPEKAALRKTSSENVIVTPEPRRERNLSPETRLSLIPNKENLKKIRFAYNKKTASASIREKTVSDRRTAVKRLNKTVLYISAKTSLNKKRAV